MISFDDWITVNKRKSKAENKVSKRKTPVPVNFKNRFENREEPSITEQPVTARNSHQNIPIENTKSKSRFQSRNINSIRQEGKKNQRRLENCITEKYLNNHVTLRKNQRVVPGNKTYASATKYGRKIMVIDYSHLKRIKRNPFNNSFNNALGFIKSFGGAKTEHTKHFFVPSLKEQKPDITVIHVGGNDINYKNKDNVNVNELADNIVSLPMI